MTAARSASCVEAAQRQALRAATGATRLRCVLGAAVAACILGAASAHAVPLDQRIPGLFGGLLKVSTQPEIVEPEQLRFADQFRSLSADLAAARSQSPIPSASGAFRFAWDEGLDTFVRGEQSLGPSLAERAQTLGRHIATLSVAYTHIGFDTFEGSSLNRLSFSQSALSDDLKGRLSTAECAKFCGDVLHTRLNLGLSFDALFFTAAYGITDSVDVSMALSVNQAHMQGTAVTTIENPDGQPGSVFPQKPGGGLVGPGGRLCASGSNQCATDGFDANAFGTGDLFLRGKWHFYDTTYADLAVAGVLTLPTGNADDFLGFHDPTFTPWLIASKSFGRFSPHLNLGYAFRSGQDVSQAQWITGVDVRTTAWLTLAADFLGYHDDKRDGINDDVLQSAVGFKLNPFGQWVIAGNFQFPLNRDGLRANVIYTGQIEYTFE
ncbi:MAG TPA: hypothetical protein VN812_16705 [Candidatus Acidoferrales bacterium]|nr:hypothetical protein [Candidatus Acidoferrales bacterium]